MSVTTGDSHRGVGDLIHSSAAHMGGGARVFHGFASQRLCPMEELRDKEIKESVCIG